MSRRVPAAVVAATLLLGAASADASVTAAATQAPDPLAAFFVRYFYHWKSDPKDLLVSDLKVLNAGGSLRVLCGAYDMPGQSRRPFLVLGDDKPSASAAWEPGSFPESDPLYPQLMDNLRLCQTLGVAVTTAQPGPGAQGPTPQS
jgi:hypothetical protein